MEPPEKCNGLWTIVFRPIDGNNKLIKNTNDQGIKIMDVDSTEYCNNAGNAGDSGDSDDSGNSSDDGHACDSGNAGNAGHAGKAGNAKSRGKNCVIM